MTIGDLAELVLPLLTLVVGLNIAYRSVDFFHRRVRQLDRWFKA
jgi:uncharacterized membrane protein